MAVFGNPGAKFSNPLTAALPPFSGPGIDLCADGDPICSRGRNPFAHTRYESLEFHPAGSRVHRRPRPIRDLFSPFFALGCGVTIDRCSPSSPCSLGRRCHRSRSPL